MHDLARAMDICVYYTLGVVSWSMDDLQGTDRTSFSIDVLVDQMAAALHMLYGMINIASSHMSGTFIASMYSAVICSSNGCPFYGMELE